MDYACSTLQEARANFDALRSKWKRTDCCNLVAPALKDTAHGLFWGHLLASTDFAFDMSVKLISRLLGLFMKT